MTASPGFASRMGGWLERQWSRCGAWHLLLLPLSGLFCLLSSARRLAYRWELKRSVTLSVPVIVVGNISVGGTGKTPLVLWLVRHLMGRGFTPGIVSRGYGGKTFASGVVPANGNPRIHGDEPVLLAQKSGVPVWTGGRRAEAGRALLAAHPECNVIISDDGLQHYALRRQVEIAVIDGVRGLGNGFLLPAGPLREGPWRLNEVDAVVVNGSPANTLAVSHFSMDLVGEQFRNLESGELRGAAAFQGLRLHALAGIGNPARFFDHLRRLGLDCFEHAFPDHYPYRREDMAWADADAILMTEKDGVKCAGFGDGRLWALEVEAVVDEALGDRIVNKLKGER